MARGKPTKKASKHSRKIKPPRTTKKEQDGLEMEVAGLLPKWLKFIDEYMDNNFNGARAYLKVYNVKNIDVARSAATRLLSYVSVNAEIQNRLNTLGATDNFVIGELMKVANQKISKSTTQTKVQALRILAQTKGLLTNTIHHEFTADNPAIFLPVITKEEMKKFKKVKRIEE